MALSLMVTAIGGGIILGVIVIGGAYMFFIFSRPKKITWNARVYVLSEGVKTVDKFLLQDLRPHMLDVIEKEYKNQGIVLYRLQKMNRSVPPITDDMIDRWSDNNREVSILLQGEICTVLKKGYDKTSGTTLFTPVSYDRLSLITHETIIRKERHEQKKTDLLLALAPYFMAALIFVALVANGYFLSKSFITVAEKNEEMTKNWLKGNEGMTANIDKLTNYIIYKQRLESMDINTLKNQTIIQEAPPVAITDG